MPIPSADSPRDFTPTASWPMLRLRAEMLRRVRAFFDERGFLEVETPLLSADAVVDRHLDPFVATLADDPRRPDQGRRLYLQTSPEFAMKRLLAAGGEAIFQITRAFRNGERGARHNPEFTIVEWYRRGDDFRAGRELLGEFAAALGRGPAESLSYRDAFWQHTGLNPHRADVTTLAEACRRLRVDVPASLSPDDRDAWLDLLLTACVEPRLGIGRPTILHDYPASQAALARLRRVEDDSQPYDVAERFELYADGVELANGYHELLDPAVLRARNAAANRLRAADGKPTLPEESYLLAAMDAGLPACAGVALGFDRLVMVAAGAKQLADVIPFPIERA